MTESQNAAPPLSLTWPKADEVWVEGETIKWRKSDQSWKLDALKHKGLHVEYLNLDSRNNDELISFLYRFGPPDMLAEGTSRLSEFWVHQNRLLSLVRMKSAFSRGEAARNHIQDFFAANDLLDSAQQDDFCTAPPLQLGLMSTMSQVREWLQEAKPREILQYAGRLLQAHLNPDYAWERLVFEVKGGKGIWHSAPQTIGTIHEVARLLTWLSERDQQPSLICANPTCGKIFQKDNEHQRRYCSRKCQHSENMRENRRRKTPKKA